jgi:hypothetical protein
VIRGRFFRTMVQLIPYHQQKSLGLIVFNND